MKVVVFLLALVAWSVPAGAVQPDEILSDPVLEKRARDIGQHLRCVVCQNQSIDDSNSDLAGDMRVLVRKRLQAGASDSEVIDYMVSSYGDYVLLDPPFKASTYVLWLGPAAIGLAGVAALVAFFRRRRAVAASDDDGVATRLSADEEARFKKLLEEDDA